MAKESSNFKPNDSILWMQEVVRRDSHLQRPMGSLERQLQHITDFFSSNRKRSLPQNNETHSDHHNRDQFTVTRTIKSKTWKQSIFFFSYLGSHDCDPSLTLIRYVNWTFTTSSIFLFLHILILYIMLSFIFALLLLWAGNAYPKCIIVGGEPLSESPNALADSFSLSWTTFTTVGYGMSYGGTSSHEPSHGRCTSVIMLLSIEALIGLMYAGMCASILFGKMNRLQSYAPVLFSHTLCINFSDPQMHNDKSSLGNLDDMLMTQKENEIAITDEKGCIGKNLEVDHELQSTHFQSKWMKSLSLMTLNSSNKGEKKKLQTQSSRIDPQNSLLDITYNFTTSQPCPCLSFQIINQLANGPRSEIFDACIKVVVVKVAPTGKSKIFANLPLEEFQHPYFHRLWHARHTLDKHSTLLTSEARKIISQYNGWPRHWNSSGIILEKLNFSELIVALSGISNISGSQVIKHKRYKISDLLVGYEFAPLLYQESGSKDIKVDMSLQNDVLVQRQVNIEQANRADSITTETINMSISSLI